jgi:hypothetical protein
MKKIPADGLANFVLHFTHLGVCLSTFPIVGFIPNNTNFNYACHDSFYALESVYYFY